MKTYGSPFCKILPMKSRSLVLLLLLFAITAVRADDVATIQSFLDNQTDDAAVLHGVHLACLNLTRTGTADAVPVLKQLLDDKRFSTVTRTALTNIPGDAGIKALRESLNKITGPENLAATIQTLGAVRDAESAPAIIKILEKTKNTKENAELLEAAVRALGNIASPKAQVEGFYYMEVDMPLWYFDAALTAADRLGREGDKELAKEIYGNMAFSFESGKDAAMLGLIRLEEEKGLSRLADLLQGKDRVSFNVALYAVVEMKSDLTGIIVLSTMGNLPIERQAALVANLGVRKGDRDIVPRLIKLAEGEQPALRLAALQALGEIGDASALDVILLTAGASDAELAQAATDSLKRFQGDEFDKKIVALLDSDDKKLRLAALELIGKGIGLTTQDPIENFGANHIIVRTVKPANPEMIAANRRNISVFGLKRDDYDRILQADKRAATPAIVASVPIREIRGNFAAGIRETEGRLVGTTPIYAKMLLLEMDRGRFISDTDNQEARQYCVLSAGVAEKLFQSEDPIGKTIRIQGNLNGAGFPYEVVGVVKPRGVFAGEDFTNDVYIPIETLRTQMRDIVMIRKDGVFEGELVELSQITLQVSDQKVVKETAEMVKLTLQQTHKDKEDFKVIVPPELIGERQIVPAIVKVDVSAVDKVEKLCADSDPAIRKAAYKAFAMSAPATADDMRFVLIQLAFRESTSVLTEDDRNSMREALLTLCRKTADRDKAVELFALRLKEVDSMNGFYLDCLFQLGGEKAAACLASVAMGTDDALCDKATQLLGRWTTPEVAPHLLLIAEKHPNERYRSRTLSGYLRVVRQMGLPVEQKVQMAEKAVAVASRDTDKQRAEEVLNRFKTMMKGTPIFDGKTFDGWEFRGNEKWFRIEDGAIVCGSLEEQIPRNEFITSKKEYGDFTLRIECKVIGKGANGGVQFRSVRAPVEGNMPNEMIGYQADMTDTADYWGALYDESRRNRFLADAKREVVNPIFRPNDWNEYEIVCKGNSVKIFLNGVQTVEYTETEANIPTRGFIGLQIHSGPPSETSYRNIRIEE
jgi:HEAT repeat protein